MPRHNDSIWSKAFFSVLILAGVFSFTYFSSHLIHNKLNGVNQFAQVPSATINNILCDMRTWFGSPCKENEVIEFETTDGNNGQYTDFPSTESNIGTTTLSQSTHATTSNIIYNQDSVTTPSVREIVIRDNQLDSSKYVSYEEYTRQVAAIIRSIESVSENTPTTIVQSSGNSNIDSLEDLSDVASMTEVVGDLFTWNGTNWTNIATSSLGLSGDSQWINAGADIYYTSGNVAIGTTTAISKLAIYGDLLLEGSSRYLNFGTVSGTSGYGLRDNSGVLEMKNNGGTWNTFLSGSGTSTQLAYFGSDGTLTSSPLISYDGYTFSIASTTKPGTELVTNGTFNGDATGWTLPSNCAEYDSGAVTILYDTDCQNDANDPLTSTTVQLEEGIEYTLTFNIVSENGDSPEVYFDNMGNDFNEWDGSTELTDTRVYTFTFTSDYSGSDTLYFGSWNANSDAGWTIDDVSLKKTSSSHSTLTVGGKATFDTFSATGLDYNASGTLSLLGGTELLTNGTFDGDATGWTLPSNCAEYNSGAVTVLYDTDCQNDANEASIQTSVSLVNGRQYDLTFTITTNGDQPVIYFDNNDPDEFEDAGGNLYSYGTGTHTVRFTANYTSAETLTFESQNWDTNTGWTIDNVSLKPSTVLSGSNFQVGSLFYNSSAFYLGSTTPLYFTSGDNTSIGLRNSAGALQYRDASGIWSGFAQNLLSETSGGVESYDITTSASSSEYSVSSKESNPYGLTFSNDGTKMFVVGTANDRVQEFSLSSAFDVSTASYVQNFSVSSQDTSPSFIAFNADGTKMFIFGDADNDVNEYTLSPGYDISTASFVDSFSFSSQSAFPTGLTFNTDGTKMYTMGTSPSASIYQYQLSSSFDISSATYTSTKQIEDDNVGTVHGLRFSANGKKLYVVGSGTDGCCSVGKVYEYALGTGFDVTTADYTGNSTSTPTNTTDVAFNSSGAKMYVIGFNSDKVTEYTLADPISANVYLTDTGSYFGIGTTSPRSTLDIWGTNGSIDNLLSIASSSGDRYLTVASTGNVGIGTTTATSKLTIVGSAGSSNIFSVASSTGSSMLTIAATGNATFVGSGGTCTINGSGSCSSDERLKNITANIDGMSALEKLATLRTVAYTWKDPTWDQNENIGVLAQDILVAYPQLVGTATSTFMGEQGSYYTVNYAGLTVPLIAAVQELNLKLEDLATTTMFADLQEDSFIKHFFNNLIAWFSDTANGIGTMVANTFLGNELCLKDEDGVTCYTRADFAEVMNGRGKANKSPKEPVESEIISDEVITDDISDESIAVDLCPNLPEEQSTIPTGYSLDEESGECIEKVPEELQEQEVKIEIPTTPEVVEGTQEDNRVEEITKPIEEQQTIPKSSTATPVEVN